MNTYSKFVPNVFLAKCTEKHEKGETITVETRYGNENDSIVFNLIFEKDGYYYYSIVRSDGFNVQERAEKAASKSEEYFNKSNKDSEFLSLGEPIKVGHHSERKHRKIIDEAWRNTGKAVEFSDKAADNQIKANNWSKRTDVINLSMPESIDYYSDKLEKAKDYHDGLKSGKYIRDHSYSLTYAKKAVNEAKKNYDLAIRLWGDNDKEE